MGIKERKERHREDLKQLILDTAKALFTRYGYEATSIRKIAAEIEFSPTTIYLYYKDKNDIMYALHQEGFKLLAQKFSSLIYVEHPFERLKAMGRNYMQFALENSDFYELMFIMQEPMQFLDTHCDKVEWLEGFNTFNYLLKTIQDCQGHGYFKGQELETFALLVWSTMHGLCSLAIRGHLDHIVKAHQFFDDGSKAMEASFESFVKVLEGVK